MAISKAPYPLSGGIPFIFFLFSDIFLLRIFTPAVLTCDKQKLFHVRVLSLGTRIVQHMHSLRSSWTTIAITTALRHYQTTKAPHNSHRHSKRKTKIMCGISASIHIVHIKKSFSFLNRFFSHFHILSIWHIIKLFHLTLNVDLYCSLFLVFMSTFRL